MTALEKDIERKLRLMVEKHGGKCLKWVCPGWAGVPDRIILLPRGKVIFAEIKKPKSGKLSRRQVWWQDELRRLGFWAVVVWDPIDVAALEMIIIDEINRK